MGRDLPYRRVMEITCSLSPFPLDGLGFDLLDQVRSPVTQAEPPPTPPFDFLLLSISFWPTKWTVEIGAFSTSFAASAPASFRRKAPMGGSPIPFLGAEDDEFVLMGLTTLLPYRDFCFAGSCKVDSLELSAAFVIG
ncbi:hypothetical protein CDAR_204531 [Caerostris darwini]|uniref:Uncharacterized protein n=1 Tax=Caerostris darwini TaxID=1538125 RepID=A0AAV4QZC3_9ARAC|nr:hypothetical protein CDAR_204531 [Caerostris darwini]